MREQNSSIGLIFVSIYIVLVIVATFFLIIMLGSYPAKSEFSAVYIGILTLPWSILILALLDYWGIMTSTSIVAMILIGSAIINAVILYWIGSKNKKQHGSLRVVSGLLLAGDIYQNTRCKSDDPPV